MCSYCKEAREQNVQNFVFPTVDDVYKHWKLNHSNDGTDKPFRFYLVDLLFCYMDSCWYFSTFQGVQRHHQKKHPNDLFVPILNNRCALCLHSGNDLREHSCDSLQNGMQLKLYNPVLLTDQDLAELQAIESQELKQTRSKPIECQNCGCIFGTRQEMTHHHHQKHGYGHKSKFINFKSENRIFLSMKLIDFYSIFELFLAVTSPSTTKSSMKMSSQWLR